MSKNTHNSNKETSASEGSRQGQGHGDGDGDGGSDSGDVTSKGYARKQQQYRKKVQGLYEERAY